MKEKPVRTSWSITPPGVPEPCVALGPNGLLLHPAAYHLRVSAVNLFSYLERGVQGQMLGNELGPKRLLDPKGSGGCSGY